MRDVSFRNQERVRQLLLRHPFPCPDLGDQVFFDADFDAYLRYLRDSVEILCTRYGSIGGFWFENYVIGVVIGLAMVINLVVAGFAGAVIPLILDRQGIDPAVASSVILTTVTDIVGFMVFLGLATIILL